MNQTAQTSKRVWKSRISLLLIAVFLTLSQFACSVISGSSEDDSLSLMVALAAISSSSSSSSSLDTSLFLSGALDEAITTSTCTLSNNSVTTCYKIVVNDMPDHSTGPWCPATVSETGGYWVDHLDNNAHVVNGTYLTQLEGYGWDIIQADNTTVNVTTDLELETVSTQEGNGWTFSQAQTSGIVNHCIQATHSNHSTTLYIPVTPQNLSSTVSTDAFGEAMGVSLNGVLFFPTEPVSRITKYQNIAPLDSSGGHTGFSYDYHYHRDWITPNSATAIKGYMRDGYALYGPKEADGTTASGLDSCQGHEHDSYGYHYHSSESTDPYFMGCFKGAYGEMR